MNPNENELEEMVAAPSRLGKEAKIGVALIAGLLVVLVAVAVVRFRGSSDDEPAAVAASPAPTVPSRPAPLLKDAQAKLSVGNSKNDLPRIVPAVAEAKLSEKKKDGPALQDPWKQVASRTTLKQPESAPALLPPPPAPPVRDRYALDDLPDVKEPPAGQAVPDKEATAVGQAVPDKEERQTQPDLQLQRQTTPQSRRYEDFSTAPAPVVPAAQFEGDDYRSRPVETPRYNDIAPRSYVKSSPPPRRDDGKIEVQPNDSYWTISERLYGMGAYFKALARHNNDGDGEPLQPGELILAPTLAELERAYPDLCPKSSRREAMQSQNRSRTMNVGAGGYRGGRVYTVVEGDTLFNIARYELGKASRWAEIYEMNRDVLGKDFHYLTPGTKLALPAGEKSDRVAQPPSDTYRR